MLKDWNGGKMVMESWYLQSSAHGTLLSACKLSQDGYVKHVDFVRTI